MFYKILTCLFLSLSLFSCANSVTAKYQAKFDFSTVNSYSLFDRNSPYANYQNLSDPLRNTIELVIEKSLDQKGYQYKDNEQADLIVAYYIVSFSNKSLKAYTQGVKYCGYCLTSVHSKNKGKIDLTPGNLLIDLISTKTKRTVWRASAPLDFDEDDISYEVKDKLTEVIGNMLDNLADKS